MFKKTWSTESLIDAILTLRAVGPLNSHHVSTEYPAVYAAAGRLFGSWRKAIEACGISYDEVRKYRAWSREKVLRQIRERHHRHLDLSSRCVQQQQKSLYMAAVHHFSSWQNAVNSAGLKYDTIRIRRSMSPAQIRREIRRLYRSGIDLAYPNMRQNYQYLLTNGMKKLGNGSWAEARRVCGITENFRSLQHRKKFTCSTARGGPAPGKALCAKPVLRTM